MFQVVGLKIQAKRHEISKKVQDISCLFAFFNYTSRVSKSLHNETRKLWDNVCIIGKWQNVFLQNISTIYPLIEQIQQEGSNCYWD